MHDPLPVGLIPLSTDAGSGNNWACTIYGDPINVVDCLGDLNPTQSVTIKISVFMTAESGKPFDNEACVDPDHLIEEYSPPGRTDNCSTHTTVVVTPPKRSPNLFLTKNAAPIQVTAGQALTYTIGVQNIGDADAAAPVKVKDTLPSSVTIVDAGATDGWTCTQISPITCTDAGTGLSIGSAVTITVHVLVKQPVTVSFVNTATADPATHNPAETDAEDETLAHQADNAATAKSIIGGSGFDLVMSKITDNPDPVAPGQGLKYTIVALNAGTADANPVHIKVELPTAGATFTGADGSNGFNCTAPVLNVIDCQGDLPGGGDTTITVSMIANLSQPNPPPDLALKATIDPANAFTESEEGNNTLTEVTTISGTTCSMCVDLVAAQLIPSEDPNFSGSETFKFQVVNVGDLSTTLNPATDTLIEFFYFTGTSVTPGTPTSSDPNITCTSTSFGTPTGGADVVCKGNLGPGKGVTITVPMTNIVGDLFAFGVADPDNKVAETREDNNELDESIVVF